MVDRLSQDLLTGSAEASRTHELGGHVNLASLKNIMNRTIPLHKAICTLVTVMKYRNEDTNIEFDDRVNTTALIIPVEIFIGAVTVSSAAGRLNFREGAWNFLTQFHPGNVDDMF
jgi:hypothetical protein